jgi:hypothetical protein
MANKEDGGGSTGTTPVGSGNTYVKKKKSFTDEIGKYIAIVLAVGLVAVALSKLI